jgi:hypothetical protein
MEGARRIEDLLTTALRSFADGLGPDDQVAV